MNWRFTSNISVALCTMEIQSPKLPQSLLKRKSLWRLYSFVTSFFNSLERNTNKKLSTCSNFKKFDGIYLWNPLFREYSAVLIVDTFPHAISVFCDNSMTAKYYDLKQTLVIVNDKRHPCLVTEELLGMFVFWYSRHNYNTGRTPENKLHPCMG